MQGTYFNLIPSELITDVIIEYLSLEDLYNFVELFDENINQKILLFLLRSYHNKDLYNVFIHYKDNIPSIRIIKMLLLTVGVGRELQDIGFFQKTKNFFNWLSGSNYEVAADRVRDNFHKKETKVFFKVHLIYYYPKMYDKMDIIKKIIKHEQEYYLWKALVRFDEIIDEYGHDLDGINIYIETGINYSKVLDTFISKVPILLYYLYFHDSKVYSKVPYSIVNVIINKIIKELPLEFEDETEARRFLEYVLYTSKL